MCFSSSDNDIGGTGEQNARPATSYDNQSRQPTQSFPLRTVRPSMTSGSMRHQDILRGADAIHESLGNIPYAFIGGVACAFLGSTRGTHDFDILVPNGTRRHAFTALSQNQEYFGSTQRDIWAKISNRRYNVDIMEPRDINETFSEEDVIEMDGVRILHPERLLEYKARAFRERDSSRAESRQRDRSDIDFLQDYLGQ